MSFLLPYDGKLSSPPAVGAPVLEARGVNVRYPGLPAPALADFSLTVPAGTRVALVGANGAGKPG